MEFTYVPGATLIDPDEAAGLIPKHISTQAELNAWEEANIVIADTWAFRQKKRDILDEGFVRDLHSRMFNKTWRWAGEFRSSNKNIGVEWSQVAVRLHALLENTRYQADHQSFPPDNTKNCFGKPARDNGHSLVPEPPQRMTGIIFRGLPLFICA